ncbi:MAG: radical SAM protein [Elusimicrobiaceae bacterium]|nr:radical SAM protein [Elusimicrobiaceae bacterium]
MKKKLIIIKRFCHRLLGEWFPIREKPLVLQMPITSRCNSCCVTCNVWKLHERKDIDATILKEALKDPFFSEVQTVGINGGEFSLVPNFMAVLEALISLPHLESIYLITNGIATEKIKEHTKSAKSFCSAHDISVTLCISLDGVGNIHDTIRGIPGNFEKTVQLIKDISSDQSLYCDNLVIGHTLSRFNIDKAHEIEEYLAPFDVTLDVHLAVPNKRIGTYTDHDKYNILADDKSRQLAAEYFYSRFLYENNLTAKARYFVNYYYLKNNGEGRLASCLYRYRDVTIDENLNLRLCATASESLGNLGKESASSIIKNNRTKKEAKRLLKECNKCIHYAYYPLTIKGRILFAREVVKQQYSMTIYKCTSGKQRFKAYLSAANKAIKMVVKYDY